MDGSPAASGQSLRGSVEVGRDSNGAKGATVGVSCHGGEVLSSKTEHGEELLFMSSKAACKPPHAMRGGIPICFSKACSWFGPTVKERVLPFVRLISKVSRHGEQVLSWKTEHGEELLFMSSKAVCKPPHVLRGGIPTCFSKACSWFGTTVRVKALPFVRLISEVSCRGGQVLSWKTEHGEELLFMSSKNELVDRACKDFLATFISRMIVFPLDTINQRLIMLSPESDKGVLLLHTVFEMMRNEGFRVLYKGAGAQAFLVAGTTCGVIIVVEVVWRKYFSK